MHVSCSALSVVVVTALVGTAVAVSIQLVLHRSAVSNVHASFAELFTPHADAFAGFIADLTQTSLATADGVSAMGFLPSPAVFQRVRAI